MTFVVFVVLEETDVNENICFHTSCSKRHCSQLTVSPELVIATNPFQLLLAIITSVVSVSISLILLYNSLFEHAHLFFGLTNCHQHAHTTVFLI
jgi:hypothetical protein